MDAPVSYHHQARSLLSELAARCSQGDGKQFGSMSSSLYDTAWVSMIRKPIKLDSEDDVASSTWLFPECFEVVLAQQLPSGAWESYATPVDGILNTAAALLSLTKHLQIQPDNHDWLIRTQKAKVALTEILNAWDMYSTDQVGQEILVISLLKLLEKEGVSIAFPSFRALQAARDAKLAKIPPETVYKTRSTLYHSLEAFIGHINFDNVSQWREADGSLMASPAATAAYLMNSSTWDDLAESYLRAVLDRDNGVHAGAVPCAWPTTIFEISWVIPTLAVIGVTPEPADASAIIKLQQDSLRQGNGLLGFGMHLVTGHYISLNHHGACTKRESFMDILLTCRIIAPGILPDVDDTAKGLETLHWLGQDSNIEAVFQAFEGKEHFLTYPGERNPSFSANCNVLTMLLVREDRAHYVPQISKAAYFLASHAFNGHVKEKWHRSELYWMMLLARAFSLFYRHEAIARTVFDMEPSLQEKIPMVLLQVLMRILYTQHKNGSWDGICEITSYSILTLSSLLQLPFVRQLDKGKIVASLALGKSFLQANNKKWTKGSYSWIEKVTYSSDVLSKAYCLAAVLVPQPSMVEPESATAIVASSGGELFLVPEPLLNYMRKAGSLLARTPLFRTTEPSIIGIAEMQACFAYQALQRDPLDIFPRTTKDKDKYTFIIPLALTLSTVHHGCSTSLSVLYEMMVLSTLNFHADEYMEGVIEKHFSTDLDTIRALIRSLFATFSLSAVNVQTNFQTYGQNNGQNDVQTTGETNGQANGLNVEMHTADRDVENPAPPANSHNTGLLNNSHQNGSSERPSVEDVRHVLSRFLNQILRHPAVLSSPARLQAQLASELQTFLLAHITQAEDNCCLRAQLTPHENHVSQNGETFTHHDVNGTRPVQYHVPGRTFYQWVRGTSADHTSCPFSFVFFECLVYTALFSTSHSRRMGTLSSARTAYLAEDACRHLASLCRIYNDYGSLSRDAEERSLNSVNFLKFSDNFGEMAQDKTSAATSNDAKSELLWIAEYERRGLNTAMGLLEEELGPGDLMTALRMFVDLTDLYGQIYILKDVGTRTQ